MLGDDEDDPQVCLDEKLVTRHADVVTALPMQVGQPERIDYEYERVGTARAFAKSGGLFYGKLKVPTPSKPQESPG